MAEAWTVAGIIGGVILLGAVALAVLAAIAKAFHR